MKKKTILSIILPGMLWITGAAQVAINTDGSNCDPNAMLDVKNTSKGVLIPRLTSSSILSLSSPTSGLLAYCTDCNNGAGCMQIYEGSGWHCVGIQPVYTSLCGSTQFYYPVSAAGYTWLDRNLGASRVANSSYDYPAYGSLYQWGRSSDGHQCITWTDASTGTAANGTTTTLCTGGTCPNALFVENTNSPWDWNSPSITTLWNGTSKGTNDPCPAGYRVPTQSELVALNASFSPVGAAGAMNSAVRLPLAGIRLYSNGSLTAGYQGYIWGSTLSGVNGYVFIFQVGTASVGSMLRSNGMCVRCIAQ